MLRAAVPTHVDVLAGAPGEGGLDPPADALDVVREVLDLTEYGRLDDDRRLADGDLHLQDEVGLCEGLAGEDVASFQLIAAQGVPERRDRFDLARHELGAT